MPFALNFYHDQVDASGASTVPLPAAHRILYVRHGSVAVNDRALGADEAIYLAEPVMLKSLGAWSQVWRWELAPPNAAPMAYEGTGALSSLRMARIITTLALNHGTRWVFRLDQITSAAGRVADRHQHPGPGIRCLKEGAFNVESVESYRDLAPGDAWFETGCDTVIAWGSRQIAAKFMRGMILPAEWEGKVTGTWLSGDVAGAGARNWKLYLDKVIEL